MTDEGTPGRHDAAGAGDEPRAIEWVEAKPDRAGCGVTGCLYGAAALFVLLLGAMIVVAMTRMWIAPVVPR
jgi:hypothetical protein